MKKFLGGADRAFQNEPKLKYLAGGVLFFLAVTLAVVVYASSFSEDHFASFWISLTASFVEDLVFFSTLGLIAVLISINKPGDDVFENRARFFFNGKHVTEGARKHISDEMKQLGIFSPLYKATVTFGEYCPDKGAFKVVFQVDRTIVNMFKDQHFEDEQHEYMLKPDLIEGAVPAGEMLDVYTGIGIDRASLIVTPIQLTAAGYAGTASLALRPDAVAHFGYRAWMWFKVGEEYGVAPARYTEQIDIVVVNQSGKTLKIDCLADKCPITLTPGAERPYTFSRVPAKASRSPFKLLEVLE